MARACGYWLTLYGSDGYEKFTHRHSTKSDQLAEYYSLIGLGHKKSSIEKGSYYA